jgi:hypothetical protein
LEPAENFQSFFNYNDRLRKLVKRYVNYNRRALDKDIERFSTLHSWYKHLSFIDGGVTFYMVPLKGEQERYNFDPRISDHIGIHWHFWREESMPLADKRIEEISQKYPIKLNPSFHPCGSSVSGVLVGSGPDFVRQYYPEQFQRFETTLFHKSFTSVLEAWVLYKDDAKLLVKYIEENEPKRLRNSIQQAARSIWKEIQALEDINILEIKYAQRTAGSVMLVTLNQN